MFDNYWPDWNKFVFNLTWRRTLHWNQISTFWIENIFHVRCHRVGLTSFKCWSGRRQVQQLQLTQHVYQVFFSCDQAALWMVFSVCLSVCPSVRHTFWLCSHHHIIMKFSGVITTDQGNVLSKGQGQRSKVKVTEVTTQLSRFRTVTPVWIHIWWRNDIYSLILLRRGALLFFKVIGQSSRSYAAKNRRIWPRLGVSGL